MKINNVNLMPLPELVYVRVKEDLPTPVGGVITLQSGYTYFFTTVVDLLGDRIVCGKDTTLLGGSSENCRIKSTGLIGTALITSNWSIPIRSITIEADVAINFSGDGVTTAIDWFGVNFTNCNTIGTIKSYSNVIMQDCAFLESSKLTFDGTIGSIGLSSCLFNGNAGNTIFNLPSTLTITRRFRIIFSSFVVLTGEVGINVSSLATIPADGYILVFCNFSGGGTYLNGVDVSSNKSLFVDNIGITNTSYSGHYRMTGNTTATTFTSSNTWNLVSGTTFAAYGNSPKFVHTNRRLTYVGAITQDFYVTGTVTLQTASINQTFGVTFAVNGVPQDSESLEVRTGAANQPFQVSGIALAPLSTNDYVELYVKNLNNTNSVTVTDFNLILQRVAG
jgi:hypothetical protein